MSSLIGVFNFMKNETINSNKIDRKKFFFSIGLISAGYFAFKQIPFLNFFKSNKSKITISENPLAVKRQNMVSKNVR